MSMFRPPETKSPAELHGLKGLQPLRDPVFSHLLERAVQGGVAVYYGEVPREKIRRFDTGYDPRSHPVGRAAVTQLMEAWQRGKFSPVWVYEEGDGFVLSDDYICWAGAAEGQPDLLPCWILGMPTLAGIKDLQGPIAGAEVPKMLGFAT